MDKIGAELKRAWARPWVKNTVMGMVGVALGYAVPALAAGTFVMSAMPWQSMALSGILTLTGLHVESPIYKKSEP